MKDARINAEDVRELIRVLPNPSRRFDAASIVQRARRYLSAGNDDKAYASHNEVIALLSDGAIVTRRYENVREVTHNGVTFVHVCATSEHDCCWRPGVALLP